MLKALPLNFLVVVSLLALASSDADAKNLSGQQIFEKSYQVGLYAGDDMRANVKMTIIDKKGSKRVREFSMLRRNGSKRDQDYFVYFNKPADIARTTLIAKKKTTGSDDRWVYLPGLDLVKRIASADKRTSFVGSDFFYEDISGRDPGLDSHKLTKTTDNYFILENKPIKSNSAEFTHYKAWIHKKTFILTKMEYYKKSNHYRTVTVNEVKELDGHLTITKTLMEDLSVKTKTELKVTKVKYGIGIPSKIFTERYLRNKPVKYLK